MSTLVDAEKYPSFSALIDAVLAEWPKHLKYLTKNIGERSEDILAHSERLSRLVLKLAPTIDGGLKGLAADYQFISQNIVLPEELHFRRHDEYRLKTFAEALETVYSNKTFMTRYMNGLLVTDVLWLNHCKCMKHYVERFLPQLGENPELLEIGPGHGLLLCLAAEELKSSNIYAWDISQASLDSSKHSMNVLAPSAHVEFQLNNLFDEAKSSDQSRFDGIVFSEVLEHMEEPLRALQVLHRLCKTGGKVWINVPANSPAPDHLYLVRTPQQAADILEEAGFTIVETASFPMSGKTLEAAIEEKLTINCVLVGQKN